MTEGNYSNVGHRGPVYKGLGAMNPRDNLRETSSWVQHGYSAGNSTVIVWRREEVRLLKLIK
jgi:hypothetical protein